MEYATGKLDMKGMFGMEENIFCQFSQFWLVKISKGNKLVENEE